MINEAGMSGDCAHIHVVHVTTDNPDGTKSNRWECSDCRSRFALVTTSRAINPTVVLRFYARIRKNYARIRKNYARIRKYDLRRDLAEAQIRLSKAEIRASKWEESSNHYEFLARIYDDQLRYHFERIELADGENPFNSEVES